MAHRTAPTIEDRQQPANRTCDACGQPDSLVGPLDTRDDLPGTCAWCAHQLDRYEVLVAELEPLMREWIGACVDRDISSGMMREVLGMVEDRVFGQESSAP